MLRKTKIVCTIGPASGDVTTLRHLITSGMNVARLNFSHGTHAEHAQRIQHIRLAAKETNQTIGILLDMKGPEIRTGDLKTAEVDLVAGEGFILTTKPILGDQKCVSVSYNKLPEDVRPGTTILIDDGLIELTVEKIKGPDIYCQITNGGVLRGKKGVNIPGVKLNLPGITEKDAADIEFGIHQGVDFIAASFVRKPQDVLEIRRILEERQVDIHIISKIENQEGIRNIDAILDVSDGLMVARGDMGVEIQPEDVPLVQKEMIRKCNLLGKPVITATQMLDSMQRNPRPTRAEASDVANAIFDGTDAVMLSGETAIGKFPIEAVKTMAQIARRTEMALEYEEMFRLRASRTGVSITDSISQAVVHTSHNLDCSAIITATESGHTAKMVSKYRPKASIVAVTPSKKVLRQSTLIWGVYPILVAPAVATDGMFQIAISASLSNQLVHQGDLVIITAGVPVGKSGTTNLMKVHVISSMIAQGQGIGKNVVTGPVIVGTTADEIRRKMVDGAIIVTKNTDKDMIDLIQRASAVITEEGGLTSHGAIVGVSLGIPVVVGVKNAVHLLKEETLITIDSNRGHLYSGRTNVL